MPTAPTPAATASTDAFVDAVRRSVDARLTAVLDRMEALTQELAPATLPVLRAARDLTLRGGKRLRPALLFAAVECAEPGAFPDAAADLGAALELLQTYLLVHDDWMDGDAVRRGAPSVHIALGRHYADDHVGAATAILTGDLMGSLVHELVAQVELPADRRRDVIATFSRMEYEVILGQCLDVTHSDDVTRIHHLKTGSYTVRGPLRLGLGVAGAGEDARRALEAYGEPLGVAFQLRDDVLGAFGSEAETGKPVGGDFREGKKTELVRWAMTHLDAKGQSELTSILGRRDATEADIERARALITASGAREHVEGQIRDLRARCLDALDVECLLPEGKERLAAFATLLTERKR